MASGAGNDGFYYANVKAVFYPDQALSEAGRATVARPGPRLPLLASRAGKGRRGAPSCMRLFGNVARA